MITPEEIVKKANRKYRQVLEAYLTGENLFPLEFPVGRLSKNLAERRHQIDQLRQRSKAQIGEGYALEWQTVNRRDLGKQTTPQQVLIETLDDYLTVVRKRTEFQQFVTDVERIRQQLPELENWLQNIPKAIIDHAGQWGDLLTVCKYFMAHPRPNLYIRELPIPVHTKFIESNSQILRDLLEVLLPAEAIDANATTFNARFGLKSPPQTIRVRLLDDQLDWQHGLRLDDLSLPIEQLAHLFNHHIKPKTVMIAENLVNFLTLPRYASSVGIFGSGFAVQLLAQVDWLHHCKIIYWGDIDAHGFQILSDLRRYFPHVRSVMMDQPTLDEHSAYIVDGNSVRVARFDGLNEAETTLAHYVLEHNIRMEQEHIPHDYALVRLQQALRAVND